MKTLCLAHSLIVAPLLLVAATSVQADTEGPNQPHVVTGDRYSGCYAKSVPLARWGTKGVTKVYEVRRGDDTLIATHKWFTKKLYLRCRRAGDGKLKVTMVRFGPWQRGRRASRAHLAIAFHAGGRELARYSTLALAGRPDNVRRSVSHYRVIRRIKGFGYENLFRIELIDGRTLTFDLTSGKMRPAK
jgi:hypothetical protein